MISIKAQSEPSQIPKKKFSKKFHFDVWLFSEYASNISHVIFTLIHNDIQLTAMEFVLSEGANNKGLWEMKMYTV